MIEYLEMGRSVSYWCLAPNQPVRLTQGGDGKGKILESEEMERER